MNRRLETVINAAIREANRFKHGYLTLESVLYAMIGDDEEAKDIIGRCGADVGSMEEELRCYIEDDSNFVILDHRQVESLSKKHFVDEGLRKIAGRHGIHYQPEISLALQRVIQRAVLAVQSEGRDEIGTGNLLVAMCQEKEGFAVSLMKKYGLDHVKVVEALGDAAQRQERAAPLEDGKQKGVKVGGALDRFTVNLNHLAEDSAIDPLIGRQEEIDRIVLVLSRRKKNNPMIVGEAGVGKTALIEGLAQRIAVGSIGALKGSNIYALDLAALLAGAKFRGDLEQRFKSLLGALEERRGSILFIDEIHTSMGAGSTAGNHVDVPGLLKTALGSGKIRCIGSTTYEEYRRFIEKEPAFSRRFQKIDVREPSLENTYKILQGIKECFEKFHGVKYSSKILRSVVDLADRYISDRKNPDKSIDVVDELGASIRLSQVGRKKVSVRDVEEIVAKAAGIPRIRTSLEERAQLADLKENLKMFIYGQDHAVEKVVDAVVMSRLGLGESRKPIASFLFAGPTGVGKTELARQLAFHLGSRLERIDMSEYMEKHSVARLIGSPPGYVGYEQGGLLTDAVKKNPHCVLLLDEMEKAHPDVSNILLQVMDDGKLTDAHGRVSDFRNAIIIMTTNGGSEEMETGTIGLGRLAREGGSPRWEKALRGLFTPEFRGRLDAIIWFHNLGEELILKVVEKFLMGLEAKLAGQNVEMEVAPRVKKWLAERGYNHNMGARPIGRIIDEEIKGVLAREMLLGKLAKGGRVSVDLGDDGDLLFTCKS